MNQVRAAAPNLFISYAHEDKKFMRELEAHLSPLVKKGTIFPWTDRKMIAGDNLDDEITKNLERADLVAFLISADFIQSVSCYEKEFLRVLERSHTKDVRIIPIVVRDCMWEETNFAKFLIVPEDAVAITRHPDRDAAWVTVARQIRENAKRIAETSPIATGSEAPSLIAPTVSDAHKKWLTRNPLAFQHKAKAVLDLKDVFVFQDLRGSRPDNEDIIETISSSTFADARNVDEGILVHGEDQSGKTSLVKTLCAAYLRSGHFPLVINGKDISTSNLERALGGLVGEQYTNLDWQSLMDRENRRILMIDDLHAMKLNAKHLNQFILSAKEHFHHVVAFANSSITYDENRMVVLAVFRRWEILPFGHARRGELIEKWNSLGNTETIESGVLHRLNDEATRSVNSLIGRNLLPPRPFYVLTMLQMLDTSMQGNFELSSYGHCYQALIVQSLIKVGLRSQDLDPYVNYLTELAYFFFRTKQEAITLSEFEGFKNEYSSKFVIRSHDSVLGNLHKAEILRSDETHLRFSYKYILYFYAAKYMSENLGKVDDDVQWLCERMYLESNANVLIFLMHHSRDQRVIDEVLLREQLIFDGLSPALLDMEETNHIIGIVKAVPDLVIGKVDVESERRKALERADRVDREYEEDAEEDEQAEADEILADIVRSARLIDVVGQILRNRSGSLHKTQLLDLVRAGLESGLKFLSFWLDFTKRHGDALVTQIADQIDKHHPNADEERRRKISMRAYVGLCYDVCVAMIGRMANCLGSRDLVEIYDELQRKEPSSIAIQLVNVSIHLEFTKKIPKDRISSLNSKLNANPIARLLLKEIILRHLYLNDVEFREKQWISSELGIPMASQRRIGSMKATKV